MKIAINICYGGFGLSDLAYEWLIKHGVPVRKYIEQKRGKDGRYKEEPKNEGKIIFDRKLSKGSFNDEKHIKFLGRYWECWIGENRSHPLVIKVIEKLKEKANGNHAKLKIVEIPDGVDYYISDYDGIESIHENHRSGE